MPHDPTFAELQSFIVGATGNFRLSERTSTLFDKASRRLQALGLSSFATYLALLKHSREGKDELDGLIAELTVGETSFFRHGEHFDALRDHVLPACLARNEHSRQLRIWSAGCANGAEAYSIAITVHSLLGPAIDEWNVSIVGSDINRTFLRDAESGSYSNWAFRNLSAEKLPAFFARDGERWSVKDRYRPNVQFVGHNLIGDEIPSLHKNIFAFDIIFCRNVMIYFDQETNRALTGRLAGALVEGGHLFVAPADVHQHLTQTFDAEKLAGASIYRKTAAGMRAILAQAALNAPIADMATAIAATPGIAKPAAKRMPPPVPATRRKAPRQHLLAMRPARAQPVATRLPDIAAIIEFANKGDWDKAARHCKEILSADVCNAVAHYYHGLILHYSGARTDAEQAWRRAIYLDREFALAHYQLGLVLKEAHDASGSAKAFHNAIAILKRLPDDRSVSPCDQITAIELRELATQQLEFLERP